MNCNVPATLRDAISPRQKSQCRSFIVTRSVRVANTQTDDNSVLIGIGKAVAPVTYTRSLIPHLTPAADRKSVV